MTSGDRVRRLYFGDNLEIMREEGRAQREHSSGARRRIGRPTIHGSFTPVGRLEK